MRPPAKPLREAWPSSTPTVLVSGQTSATGGTGAIAVDATAVYWLNFGTGNHDGSLMRVAIAGGTAVTLADGLNAPGGIAVDSTAIYWTDEGSSAQSYKDGAVMKLSKD